MHEKLFSIQVFPIFASNSAEGLHFSAFHFFRREVLFFITLKSIVTLNNIIIFIRIIIGDETKQWMIITPTYITYTCM